VFVKRKADKTKILLIIPLFKPLKLVREKVKITGDINMKIKLL